MPTTLCTEQQQLNLSNILVAITDLPPIEKTVHQWT